MNHFKSETMKSKKTKKLTDKEQRFCVEYCKDWNACQAAIRAGYSEKTAKEIGYENLTKLHIKEKIEWVKANLEEAIGISKAKVIEEHLKIAFSSIAQLHNTWIERKEFECLTEEQKACIQEISTKVERRFDDKEDPFSIEWIKIRLYDKQKALDAISKIMGYDAPVKVENAVTVSGINVNIKKE